MGSRSIIEQYLAEGVDYYHGTTRPPGQELRPNALGLVFATPDPQEAKAHAGNSRSGRVIPVRILARNLFDAANPDHLERIGAHEEDRLWDAAYAENADWIAKMKAAGFDGMKVRDTGGMGSRGPVNVAVFDASNVVEQHLQEGNTDAAYLQAVEAGDMEACQQMVDAAAEVKGYDTEGWHNTMAYEPFTVFEPRQPVRIDGTKASKYGLSYFSAERAYVREKAKTGTIRAYLNLKNPWDFRNPAHVSDLAAHLASVGIKGHNLDTITRSLEQGQWSIIEKNAVDYIRESGFDGIVMQESPSTPITYAVLSPNQIKSADPVTRDDEGNVIPLSRRFNPASNDIRY